MIDFLEKLETLDHKNQKKVVFKGIAILLAIILPVALIYTLFDTYSDFINIFTTITIFCFGRVYLIGLIFVLYEFKNYWGYFSPFIICFLLAIISFTFSIFNIYIYSASLEQFITFYFSLIYPLQILGLIFWIMKEKVFLKNSKVSNNLIVKYIMSLLLLPLLISLIKVLLF